MSLLLENPMSTAHATFAVLLRRYCAPSASPQSKLVSGVLLLRTAHGGLPPASDFHKEIVSALLFGSVCVDLDHSCRQLRRL